MRPIHFTLKYVPRGQIANQIPLKAATCSVIGQEIAQIPTDRRFLAGGSSKVSNFHLEANFFQFRAKPSCGKRHDFHIKVRSKITVGRRFRNLILPFHCGSGHACFVDRCRSSVKRPLDKIEPNNRSDKLRRSNYGSPENPIGRFPLCS